MEVEGEGAAKNDGDVFSCHLFGDELGFAPEVGTAGELAETACAAVEDVGGGGFREEEEEDDQGEAGEPEELPDRPLPTLALCGEPTDEGTYMQSKDILVIVSKNVREE